MKVMRVVVMTLAVAGLGITGARAQDIWPRTIIVSQGIVVVYQPQVESFEKNRIVGRSAVSITPEGQIEPIFGAAWIEGRFRTDRNSRMVDIYNLSVPRVNFLEASEDQREALAGVIKDALPRNGLVVSLDRILAGLALVEKENITAGDLLTFPPRIIFSETPAILITIDGEPKLRQVDGADVKQVINSPFLIGFDSKSKIWYLDGGAAWYRSDDLDGEWTTVPQPPAAIAALRPPKEKPAQGEGAAGESGSGDAGAAVETGSGADGSTAPPRIIVARQPSELVVTDGAPQWKPIEGTGLESVSNSDTDLLRDTASGRHFLLLSGRWFFSGSLDGPWINVPADHLPEGFAAIPPDDEMGHVRSFVAGTEEAEDAVLDQYIPQTVAIRRDKSDLAVTYDGAPRFEPIDGTAMAYAVNTEYAVLRIGGRHYACHQAVWYAAPTPNGPWEIADSIPEDIDSLPASSPIYNVKYVEVFDSNDEVVYVGYYPGYLGSYVYDDTIVYGTGWGYSSWYGTYYYARPLTWGYRARWNRWYGWRGSVGRYPGRFTYNVGGASWYRGNSWGPTGYHGYSSGYGRSGSAGYTAERRGARGVSPGAVGVRAAPGAGARASRSQANLYERSGNTRRNAPVRAAQTRRAAPPPAGQANNVYADRDGNVHRRTADGWQERANGGWRNSGANANRGARGAAQSPRVQSRAELERQHQARQRGENRTQQHRQSQARAPRGGGRRR